MPCGASGAVVPLDARMDGRVELRPEVCCPLVPRGARGAVDLLDAHVDGRAELHPKVCCPLGRLRFDFVFGMASEFDGNSTARTRDL